MGFVKSDQQEFSGDEQRKSSRDLAGLLHTLTTGDTASRRWAARDLIQFPQAVPELLECLENEPDPTVREAIFVTLTQTDSSDAVNGLVACLRSEEANLRNDAIEALKLMPDSVAAVMHELLHDSDPDVRIFAVNILESLRHTKVEEWLLDVIQHDGHVNVCATAVDLLAEVGSVAAEKPLLALRGRFPEEPFMHFAIDLALSRIKGG